MKVIVRAAVIAAVIATLVGSGAASAASHLISGKQIKNNSITGLDIKNRSVTSGDLTEGAITALHGARGANGAPGVPGAPGLANLTTVSSPPVDVGPGGMSFPTARCPPGTSVLGVGFYNSIADVDFAKAYGTFVGASFFNETNVTATGLHVQAICAAVATTAGVRNAPSVAAVEQQFSADVAAATARH